jgi:hypothetical protein
MYNLIDKRIINSVRESKIYENIKESYPYYSDRETVIGTILIISTMIIKMEELKLESSMPIIN